MHGRTFEEQETIDKMALKPKITIGGQPVREAYREEFERRVRAYICQHQFPPDLIIPEDGIPLRVAHATQNWIDYIQQTHYIGCDY